MSAELAILGDLPTSNYDENDSNKERFSKGKTFHPRIEFKSSSATICKLKKFPTDHYALVTGKDQLEDMGENVPAFILAHRYKAIDFREKGKVRVAYDPATPEFKAIEAEADRERPQGEMSGCMYGAEFLLALKKPDGNVVLATLLCGSKSWKMKAKKIFALERKYASFGSILNTGKFTYTGPEISTFGGSFPLDGIPNLRQEVMDFIKVSGVSVLDPEAEGSPAGEESDRVR